MSSIRETSWKVWCVCKKKRERWKGDGGENVQEEKARMTPEFAARPSASQSLQQHENQSGAADHQDQMEEEEEQEQSLWGNDEAVKGNNCRCIFFFSPEAQGRPTHANVSGDASEQSLWDTWAEPHERFVHRTLIKILLQPSWNSRGTTGGKRQSVCFGLMLQVVCYGVSLCVSCVRLLVCACTHVDVSVKGKCCWKNTTRRIKWKVSGYWESAGRGEQQNRQNTNKQVVFLGRGSYWCYFLPFFPSVLCFIPHNAHFGT